MYARHWEEISEKVGFKVEPTSSDFNFSKLLDMGLMDHLITCIAVGEKAEYDMRKEILENISKKYPEILINFSKCLEEK